MSEPARPEWHDIYTTDELASALEHHAAQWAHRHAAYAVADELRHAAACIRDLAERLDLGSTLANHLQLTVEEMQRKARAALESFKDVP